MVRYKGLMLFSAALHSTPRNDLLLYIYFCTLVHLLYGRPIGRTTRLARPSVRWFVPYGLVMRKEEQESRDVARKPRDVAAVLFGIKFADNIHYKFKSSQASKARSKHTGAKQNLIENVHSRSIKITCFGVSGKAIRDK